MDRAVILVGTETGTAEDLAEELAPPWVCEETLLPKVFEVSREGLWKITRAMSVDYVALDPPPMGQMMGYLELKPSWAFRPERSLPEGKHTFID